MREAQSRLTSAEFVEYRYLERHEDDLKVKRRTRWEYYAAGLIAEVRRSWVKDPTKVKDDAFLMEFLTFAEKLQKAKEKVEREQQITPEVKVAQQLSVEKTTWGVISGKLLGSRARKRKRNNGNVASPPDAGRPSDTERQ